MNHLVTAFLVFGTLSFSLIADGIPNEKRDYGTKLSDTFNSLDASKSGNLLQTLLDSLIKEKVVNKEQVITSLDNFEELKKKLLLLKKDEKADKITFGDLAAILKNNFDGMKEDEKEGIKNQLIALLLSEMKGSTNATASLKDRIKDIALDYLKSIGEFEPNKPLNLSEEIKKELGLNEKSKAEQFLPKNIRKLIEEKGLSPKAGMDLLSNVIGDLTGNVEAPQVALAPIYKNLYDSLIEIEPNKSILPDSFESAVDMINNIREERSRKAILNDQINLSPIRIAPHSRGRNSFNGGGNAPAGNYISGASSGKVPGVDDSEELKTCLNTVKQKRFNVELKLPGSLCASTAVSINPKAEMQFFTEQKPGEFCTIKLATASHCLEGLNLQNSVIQTRIGGRSVNSRVLRSGSVDGTNGEPVQNGNPDLAMIVASVPCADAVNLNLAKMPTKTELQDLMGRDSIPLVMQQNSEINASISGKNAATIAGQGSFREEGGVNNFLRFNTNSAFNKISGMSGDSSRIKQGDSGGTALTCKMSTDKEVLEFLYLGAISHVDVRNDKFAGTVGGVASGRSLQNLSQKMHGDIDPNGSALKIASSRIETTQPRNQSALTHNVLGK